MGLRHDGFYFVNAYISHQGRGPSEDWLPGNHKWTIVRHRPRGRSWGTSTHPSGRVRHLIRDQYVATHVSGYKVKVTIWACRQRCMSPIVTEEEDLAKDTCKACAKVKVKPSP